MIYRWQPTGLFERAIIVALAAFLLVIILLFSVVLFALVLSVAVLMGGYAWWASRRGRRQVSRSNKDPALRSVDHNPPFDK